ncbi:hypothetical protein, partial [Microcoleus sp. FACHB-1515]|uniref:hypothetical protein n=1 Tax=Cyanophyceae TaxID=3028117 RepID=UPI001A7E5E1E
CATVMAWLTRPSCGQLRSTSCVNTDLPHSPLPFDNSRTTSTVYFPSANESALPFKRGTLKSSSTPSLLRRAGEERLLKCTLACQLQAMRSVIRLKQILSGSGINL